MSDFYRPEVLQEGWKFSSSGVFCTPTMDEDSTPHASYITYIDSLPLNADPEVFGMHANADLTYSQNEVMESLTFFSPCKDASSASGGTSREHLIEDAVQLIQSKMPDNFDEEAISMAYPVRYEESMNTVLCQEVARYNRLLSIMKKSLVSALRALQGLEVMSSELEVLTDSIFDQRVPHEWELYPSLKPLNAWVDDLLSRVNTLQRWVDGGTPVAFWISGFFFPQAFLTGTKAKLCAKISASHRHCVLRLHSSR